MITRGEKRCFDGVQGFYERESVACAGPMRFSVYLPPAARSGPVPALYYLAGLTCTDKTFIEKGGAQRLCAELGVALVSCDTSPRTARFPGDDEHWDFGLGAGFYLDATQAPWSAAYRMRTHVVEELPAWIEERFPVRRDARGIFGHSMGGHGALSIALSTPGRYRSCSAFAPIVAPSRVPWGHKAFSRFVGEDRAAWAAHDACELLKSGRRFDGEILIDQGLADEFLERELKPELLESVAGDQRLRLRRHAGYDHGYYFISTFVEDHLRHHAAVLSG